MILLAGLLVLLASVFITAILRPPVKPAFPLSIYILSYANIVLTGLIANSFFVLNRQWAFLIVQGLICLISYWAWTQSGKPQLLGPFVDWKEKATKLNNGAIHPDLMALGIGLIIAFIFGIILFLVVPPNNNDGLSTYFSRVGYWLQNGSFFPWPTNRIYQISFPVNAQLQTLWIMLFWRSDRLVGLVQWIAGLAAVLTVFGLARLLKWNRPQSIFAALIYASFPQVLLQITSSQTDLLTAAIVANTVYFFLLGVQCHHKGMLVLSAIGVGLAFGTKQTLYFMVPGLGLLVLLAWKKYGPDVSKIIYYWVVCCLASFIIFASYINIINLVYFKTPFGPPDTVAQHIGNKSLTVIANDILYNVPRLLYQSIDVSSLPRPLDGYAHKAKSRLAGAIFSALHFPIEDEVYTAQGHVFDLDEKPMMQEELAWYGPLSFLLLFPAMVYQFIKGIRYKEWIRVGLVLNAILFLIIVAFIRPGWEAFQGRYFLPVITMSAPLMAGIFQEKTTSKIVRYASVSLALIVTVTVMLNNPAKPVIGKRSDWVNIWTADRATLQSLQGRQSREMFYMVDKHVPQDATLGLYTPGYILDYPLFGEHLTRRLIPIYPLENITNSEWLKAQGIQYILIQKWGGIKPTIASGWIKVDGLEDWALYISSSQ